MLLECILCVCYDNFRNKTDFNKSVVEAKKMVNTNIEKIISAVNNKRKDLLNQIDIIHDKHKKIYSDKLAKLKQMNEACKLSKRQFETISINDQISSIERLEKLNKLLAMNMINDDNEDEKRLGQDNYDNYKIIGDNCVVPGKIDVKFDDKAFLNDTIPSLMALECGEVKQTWNMQKSYSIDAQVEAYKFDATWSEQHYDISNNGRNAKVKSSAYYPAARLLPQVSQSNNKVKFKVDGHCWFGICNNLCKSGRWPGQTANAWIIKANGANIKHHGSKIGSLEPDSGDMANNQPIELTFNLVTRKIEIIANGKTCVSSVSMDVDTNNPIYFLWSCNISDSPTITLLD